MGNIKIDNNSLYNEKLIRVCGFNSAFKCLSSSCKKCEIYLAIKEKVLSNK